MPTGASSLAKPLKVVGRIFWFAGDRLDTGSIQVSIGLKYKPFARMNFVSGVERQFVTGTNAARWVLRAAYSWDLDRPEGGLRAYGLVFTDGAYAIGDNDRHYNIEARRGVSIAAGNSWRLSPHGLVGFRYQSGLATTPRGAIEGGAGLAVRRLIGAASHVDHRAIADLLFQYRPNRAVGRRADAVAGGWTAVFQF